MYSSFHINYTQENPNGVIIKATFYYGDITTLPETADLTGVVSDVTRYRAEGVIKTETYEVGTGTDIQAYLKARLAEIPGYTPIPEQSI